MASYKMMEFLCQKMRQKKQNQFLLSKTFNVDNMDVLKHFATKT